jgi:hypothetical protein
MQLTLDSDLQVLASETGADPLVFEPHVDWENFTEPNIIDRFSSGQKSMPDNTALRWAR